MSGSPVEECVGVVVKYDTSIPGNHVNATSCKKAVLDGKNGAPDWTLNRVHTPSAGGSASIAILEVAPAPSRTAQGRMIEDFAWRKTNEILRNAINFSGKPAGHAKAYLTMAGTTSLMWP